MKKFVVALPINIVWMH